MRFSSIFQLPLPLRRAAEPPLRTEEEPAVDPVPHELPGAMPEELDERVRLVGEWQLGEG